MEKQYNDLLKLYKEYIEIFNNWESKKVEEIDNYNYIRLIRIFNYLTDILVFNNIIVEHDIKHYKVVESGKII